jgi:DNA-binding LacI/PurR family transcriptional regulator
MTSKVTMQDIARRAGVSKNTVSLALRNSPQLRGETRRRIQKIARELGYQKNPTVAHLMAQLRANRTPGFKACLALLNANVDSVAFTKHPTVPTYVSGCRRRASQLGYSLDEFWLHDETLDGEKLNKILRSRGILGAIVVGLMKENRLPERFRSTWEQFPTVVTGVRTRNPALSFVCADQYALAVQAMEKALELGYQRPTLVLDYVIDRLVDGRFSAGVLIAQQNIPAVNRLKPFYFVAESKENPALFRRWLEKEKPDVILTLYNVVKYWLEACDLRIPQDIGLIQLEWRKNGPEWAGMDQHNDIVGEAATEMVVSMVQNNEYGIPAFPRATLVETTWVDGKTVRQLPVPTSR